MNEKQVPEVATADSSSSAQAAAAAAPPRTPFCRELRSKSFYLSTQLPARAEDYMDESNHCWCYLTQEPVGPDGGKVSPHRCGATRACYRSALAELA